VVHNLNEKMFFRGFLKYRVCYGRQHLSNVTKTNFIGLSKPRKTLTIIAATFTTSYLISSGIRYNNTESTVTQKQKNVEEPTVDLIDQANKAVLSGDLCAIRSLLKSPRMNSNLNIDILLKTACVRGSVEIVNLLLEDTRINPSMNDNEPFRIAAHYGHLSVLNTLLKDKRVDPSAHKNEALFGACIRGYLNIVELLLKDQRVDPSTNYNQAVLLSADFEHWDIMRLLLQDKRVVLDHDDKLYIENCLKNYRENQQLYLKQ
jgi:hypothetical protein